MNKKKLNPKLIIIIASAVILLGVLIAVGVQFAASRNQKTGAPTPTPSSEQPVIEPRTYTLQVEVGGQAEASQESSIAATALPNTSTQAASLVTPTGSSSLIAQAALTPTTTTIPINPFANVSPTSPFSSPSASSTTPTTAVFATVAPTVSSTTASTTELPPSGVTTFTTIVLIVAVLLVTISFVF